MIPPDANALTVLGSVLGGLNSIASLAEKINNVQLRQEMNGKIADLQSTVIKARTESIEILDRYETALKENKRLREQLDAKANEVFLHGVWWKTSSVFCEEQSAMEDRHIFNTVYDGPYCPLCKEQDQKWVHLKPNGQTGAARGTLVYDCEIHKTDYEVPPMR
jgi:hypothetical protein